MGVPLLLFCIASPAKEVSLFGSITLGKPLNLPDCVHGGPGGGVKRLCIYEQRVSQNGQDKRSFPARFPESERPDYVLAYTDLNVYTKHGKVYAVYIDTTGARGDARVQSVLKKKFGEPSEIDREVKVCGSPSRKPREMSWSSGGVFVRYVCFKETGLLGIYLDERTVTLTRNPRDM